MPKFIDHHEMSDVAPEMAAAIGERIKAGEADEHGVKGLNVFLGKDGTAFCLSEAPDAEAGRQGAPGVRLLARLGRRRRGAERRLGHYGTRVPLLTGTRVLACENGLAGPLCTRLLADLGADVIKIERPGVGDVTRGWDSIAKGESSGFVWMNRGKRSVALDLKDDSSRPGARGAHPRERRLPAELHPGMGGRARRRRASRAGARARRRLHGDLGLRA